MDGKQRKIVIVTTFGKTYKGLIDVPNESFRSTDMLNASNVFWKSPNEKCLDKAIQIHEVELYLDRRGVYKKYKELQIKVQEIIFFYDDMERIGDEAEKMRATAMRHRTKEEGQEVEIITTLISNSFYEITGVFYGLFKKKSNDNFIPLSNASISEIIREGDKLIKRELKLPHNFVGIGTRFIEALSRTFNHESSPIAVTGEASALPD